MVTPPWCSIPVPPAAKSYFSANSSLTLQRRCVQIYWKNKQGIARKKYSLCWKVIVLSIQAEFIMMIVISENTE